MLQSTVNAAQARPVLNPLTQKARRPHVAYTAAICVTTQPGQCRASNFQSTVPLRSEGGLSLATAIPIATTIPEVVDRMPHSVSSPRTFSITLLHGLQNCNAVETFKEDPE